MEALAIAGFSKPLCQAEPPSHPLSLPDGTPLGSTAFIIHWGGREFLVLSQACKHLLLIGLRSVTSSACHWLGEAVLGGCAAPPAIFIHQLPITGQGGRRGQA